MNKLYENVAKAIRMNILTNPLPIVQVVDKKELVEALSNYFKETDTLFNPEDFEKECEQINPSEFAKKNKEEKKQHPDECDCIKCRARTEKGGLDYDPTSDDEEFEEHERQVFRDVGINKEAK